MSNYAKRIKMQINIEAVIDRHMPDKYTPYQYEIIDTDPLIDISKNRMFSDPEPFIGEVIDYNPQFMFIKVEPLVYRAVYILFATDIPEVGSKVKITPYARRHFNGERTDSYLNSLKSEEEIRLAQWYRQDYAFLPIKNVTNPLIQSIIDGIEGMKAPDDFRTIAEMLVDANASNFEIVESGLDKNANVLPGIKFQVNSPKFTGELFISSNPDATYFNLQASQKGTIVINETSFWRRELGKRVASIIDDQSWRKTIIEVLSK